MCVCVSMHVYIYIYIIKYLSPSLYPSPSVKTAFNIYGYLWIYMRIKSYKFTAVQQFTAVWRVVYEKGPPNQQARSRCAPQALTCPAGSPYHLHSNGPGETLDADFRTFGKKLFSWFMGVIVPGTENKKKNLFEPPKTQASWSFVRQNQAGGTAAGCVCTK